MFKSILKNNFFYLFLTSLIFLNSCGEGKKLTFEEKDPLIFFKNFIQSKNEGKFQEVKDKLYKDSINLEFYTNWVNYYEKLTPQQLMDVKYSSSIILSINTLDTKPISTEFIFKETFHQDTCRAIVTTIDSTHYILQSFYYPVQLSVSEIQE